ncbi:MAG: prolyl-tRNA synthetase associated domain-containing protein [Ruminococcaceae bacterium]|nr:prolyl-tRNA synthetase associated domain-containing protein [Oscillospiraceae bacterium]
MEKYTGAPQDMSGREDKEVRVYKMLDVLGIKYERTDHERAETMQACEEIDKSLGVTMCKNLFLCNRQKTDFYLLLMRGEKQFKTKELSAQLGTARLSFGEAEYMERYLDILPGAVSVMGLMNDKEGEVTLLIDEDLLKDEYIGCHPCVNTASLKLRTEDVLEKFLPATGHSYRRVKLS